MNMPTSHDVFKVAMDRRGENPFERVSSYKLYESAHGLEHEYNVVAAIMQYVQTPCSDRHPAMLVGCTPEDMALRLQGVLTAIPEHFGGNIIPALKALTLERVPEKNIRDFLAEIEPKIAQVLEQCEQARLEMNWPIEDVYAALAGGSSNIELAAVNAKFIGHEVTQFCVLQDL